MAKLIDLVRMQRALSYVVGQITATLTALQQSLGGDISAEAQTARAAEQANATAIASEANARATADNERLLKSFSDFLLTNLSISTSGESVTFIADGISPADGIESNFELPGSLVSETQPGFATPEMVRQQNQNSADISSLRGQTLRFPAHLGGNTSPTAAQLEAIVTATGRELADGATVVDLDNSKTYTYYEVDGQWRDRGSDTVSQAGQGVLGTVMGSEAAGKVYVEATGVMSVVGWDNLTTALGTAQGTLSALKALAYRDTVASAQIDNAAVTPAKVQSTGGFTMGSLSVGTLNITG
jgi:hypothetical protein